MIGPAKELALRVLQCYDVCLSRFKARHSESLGIALFDGLGIAMPIKRLRIIAGLLARATIRECCEAHWVITGSLQADALVQRYGFDRDITYGRRLPKAHLLIGDGLLQACPLAQH